jgi:hypothetical protein
MYFGGRLLAAAALRDRPPYFLYDLVNFARTLAKQKRRIGVHRAQGQFVSRLWAYGSQPMPGRGADHTFNQAVAAHPEVPAASFRPIRPQARHRIRSRPTPPPLLIGCGR